MSGNVDAQKALPISLGDNNLSYMRREINISSYAIIKEVMGHAVVDYLPLRVRCECSMPLCEKIIEVSLAKRRELRHTFPRGFIVYPAHADTKRSIATRTTDEYVVVEILQFSEYVTEP